MSNELDTQDGEQVLQYTQKVRHSLVNSLMEANKGKFPEDPKEQKVILDALNGMDKQVLTLKKIASDEGIGDKQIAAAAMIAQVFNDPRVKSFNQIPLAEQPSIVSEADVVLDDKELATTLVPGELDPVGSVENYDSFMKRMNEHPVEE